MLTQSGGPPLGGSRAGTNPPLRPQTSRSSLFSGLSGLNDQFEGFHLNSKDYPLQSPIGSNLRTNSQGNPAATPRRLTPPSEEENDLHAFFRDEWYGVLMKPLAPETSREDVSKMLLFSRAAFEGSRIVKSDLSRNGSTKAEAYVRLSNMDAAKQVVEVLDGVQHQGEALSVIIVQRPNIADTARKMEALMQEIASLQPSPSTSDGMPTPSATIGQHATEYTTARQLISPTAGFPSGLGSFNTDMFSPISESGRRMTGPGSGEDSFGGYEMSKAAGLNAINGINGINGTTRSDSYDHYRDEGSLSDMAFGPGLQRQRRPTTGNPSASSTGRFNTLPPLSTAGMGPFPQSAVTSPVAAPNGVTPVMSPMGTNWGVTSPVNQYNSYGFPSISHPPANPADQNPPCNTLYVGNLPAQTSEDELKALFCRQRGYKRMCFRTKPQGPMCFVEFEDVHYATKALTELYGRSLSNSTKGGVRLSFSKNPLGVRSQNNPANPANTTNGTPNGGMPGSGGVPPPPGFATATHNPPGLAPVAPRMPISPPPGGTSINGAPPGLYPASRPSARDTNALFSPPPGLGEVNHRLPPPGLSAPGAASFYSPGAIGTQPAR